MVQGQRAAQSQLVDIVVEHRQRVQARLSDLYLSGEEHAEVRQWQHGREIR